jgi:hypothetical protein
MTYIFDDYNKSQAARDLFSEQNLSRKTRKLRAQIESILANSHCEQHKGEKAYADISNENDKIYFRIISVCCEKHANDLVKMIKKKFPGVAC